MATHRRKGRHWQSVTNVYIDGKRHQRTRTFATAAAAKLFAAQQELLEQRGVGSARTTLGDFLAGWLESRRETVEKNTAAGYARWVGHISRAPTARLLLERVTPLDLEALYKHLITAPAGRGKPLSPASVRHCHAVLQNALGDAVRNQLIASNPADAARAPRGQSAEITAPSATQIAALLDDLARHNGDLVSLAALIVGTGLRRSEALGLAWRDIDWTAGALTIRQVVIEHAGDWSLRQGTKSRAGRRTVPVDPVILSSLRQQQATVVDLRHKLRPLLAGTRPGAAPIRPAGRHAPRPRSPRPSREVPVGLAGRRASRRCTACATLRPRWHWPVVLTWWRYRSGWVTAQSP